MPHVTFLQLDKAAQRVCKEWEKTPQFVNQLCRALKYEQDRREVGGRLPRPQDIDPAVWIVWGRWISAFGLRNATEAAEQLSDLMFPKGRK